MVLNAYTVLDAFLVILRLFLGVLVLGLAALTWRRLRLIRSPEQRQDVENRGYLLFLLAILLVAFNIVSWPVFYLLLQSYVPQWPGVMCIYGVTQIGAGSMGASGYLPGLVRSLEIAKPMVVFLGGSWLVLYLVNRRTATGPLLGRVLCTLMVLGAVAVTDAALEAAYLVIPKAEHFLSAGCCTESFDSASRASRFLPGALFGEAQHTALYVAYFACNLGMALTLLPIVLGLWPVPGRVGFAGLVLGSWLTLAVSAAFVIEVGAPRLLHLPFHHCPYDLLPKAPESMIGVALFMAGSLAVAWAAIGRWFGDCMETKPFLAGQIRQLLSLGLFGYVAALVMMALELGLA